MNSNETQEVRDHAQAIAVREAGEIARWQQVQGAADALIPAARRFVEQALPVPRSSDQTAADRSDAYSRVEHLLLRTIVAIRFPKTNVDDVFSAQLAEVARDLHETYESRTKDLREEAEPSPELSAGSKKTVT